MKIYYLESILKKIIRLRKVKKSIREKFLTNVTIRKRKQLLASTSEKRLEKLSSI